MLTSPVVFWVPIPSSMRYPCTTRWMGHCVDSENDSPPAPDLEDVDTPSRK